MKAWGSQTLNRGKISHCHKFSKIAMKKKIYFIKFYIVLKSDFKLIWKIVAKK